MTAAEKEILDRFETAWRGGTVPRIEDYLPASPGASPQRRRLLEEMVKLDLEYRWRFGKRLQPAAAGHSGRPPGPLLEEYLACYPELRPSAELLGEEYRARRRWGDRPGHAEYSTRFAQRGIDIRAALGQVDADFAAESAEAPVSSPDRLPLGSPDAVISGLPGAAAPRPIGSVGELVAELDRSRLLSPEQMTLVRKLQAKSPDGHVLAKELLGRGWLTAYQVNQLLNARGADLVLGPYVLLGRLGEGGSGQVFKARHRRMGRLVALKVVRKDLLDDPEVVGRFYREVQVISRLTHPHIVHAYDAGPIGAMHCLVMEYVEGTDLARLVKEKGPVPFAEASTYIHQAALGLQHAHEHGLVHRDIKPPNLIVSGSGRDSCIKVLDLGLARLQRAGTAPGAASALSTGNAASLVTPVGAVLIGTPDYMAPEQALDFHHADARSDIYSLGCTFYFLLTGQPPFPGGTVVQKLWRHQQAPPPDPERADVPAPLLAILHKMLAKRPEDRYQTAAEVANALGPFATRPMPAAGPATGRLPGRRWLVASAALLIALLIWRLAAFRSQELSSLDRLDPKTIMPGDRFEGQPPQLVAILGRPKGMVLIPPNAANPFGEGVRGLAFSPDGKRLATCGYPRTVWLWDLTRSEAQEPTVLSGHTDAVSAVAFDPTGKLLATGGKDLTVRLWNLNRPQPQEQRSLHGPTRDVNTLAFGAGGKLLACGGGDAAIYWWELNESSASPKGPAKTDSWINALALSPDGRSAAAGCSYHNVWLLDLPSNTVRGAPATGHLGQVTAVAFSPDSSTLATGSLDKSVRLWDATGTQLKPRTVLQEHSNAVTSVGYALGGTFLASTGLDGKLVVWDVATQKATRVWQLHGRQIACMAVAADGRHLAAGCTDGKVYIFRLAPPTS